MLFINENNLMKYIIDYKSWILQYLFKLLDIIHDNFKDCVNSILLNMLAVYYCHKLDCI